MQTKCILLLVCLGVFPMVLGAQKTALDVSVENDGSYTVHVDGGDWPSGTTSVHSDGAWLDIWPSSNVSSSTGSDRLGKYKKYELSWSSKSDSVAVLVTAFRVYQGSPAIVFSQSFPEGVPHPELSPELREIAVSTSFPSFSTEKTSDFMNRGYLTWLNGQWGFGDTGYNLRGFDATIHFGCSVAVFYREETLSSCVLSSLTNIKLGLLAAQSVAGATEFASGLAGTVTDIPEQTTHETLLYCDATGINAAMSGWGAAMQLFYDASPDKWADDETVNYLSYWTANGAYYYYNHTGFKDYESMILGIDEALTSMRVPVRVMQLDSWWYYKDRNSHDGGLVLWEPMPDIFPHGIKYLHDRMGEKPIVLHNKWVASENKYRDKYHFLAENGTAIPDDPAWWDHIMGWAKAQGCAVYEQDWLVNTFQQMEATQTTLGVFEQYLTLMNDAAAAHGLHINYCMSLVSDWVLSVAHNRVSQSRASHDYNPGNDQWNIGTNSMLLWSLGIVPFKDNFWSTEYQPGSDWPDAHEPNSELQALVSTLSCGPVALGDSIEHINIPLVMRAVRGDGLILKPDQPAVALDCQYHGVFPTRRSVKGPSGQVWATYSVHTLTPTPTRRSEGRHRILATPLEHVWWSVLALELTESFALPVSELVRSTGQPVTSKEWWAWKWAGDELVSLHNLTRFSEAQPLALPACPSHGATVGFAYYQAAPILPANWAILGETSKFVHASKHRISGINIDSQAGTLSFNVSGDQEDVTLSVVSPSGDVHRVTCSVNGGDNRTVFCNNWTEGCTCL